MTEVLEIGGASAIAEPFFVSPRHTELPQATPRLETTSLAPAANLSDEGHFSVATHAAAALVGNLVMETRRYADLRRAHQPLDSQIKGMARYACDGDKVAGAKLYAETMKDPILPLRIWLQPYINAISPLKGAIKKQEKLICDLAVELPIWPWAETISGLGPRFLAMVIGECGIGPGEFRNPSCLWKRMGLAVINGERQRNVRGDAAVEQGYVARRRALMWNIGESIIKQQVRSEKDDKGKKIPGTNYAIGPYGEVYLERKRYEATKTDRPIIAHNRAKRYMEKRLLLKMWKAWRAAALQTACSMDVER